MGLITLRSEAQPCSLINTPYRLSYTVTVVTPRWCWVYALVCMLVRGWTTSWVCWVNLQIVHHMLSSGHRMRCWVWVLWEQWLDSAALLQHVLSASQHHMPQCVRYCVSILESCSSHKTASRTGRRSLWNWATHSLHMLSLASTLFICCPVFSGSWA